MLLLAVCLAAGAAAAVPAPADRDYLIGAIAVNYGGADLAAQVGIAAVVLRRMDTVGFPDTAAGVIGGLRAEGEFPAEPPDALPPRALRVARDAVTAAEAGADPGEGALYFRRVERRGGFDLHFDDFREDSEAKRTRRELGWCPVVIGEIGFAKRKEGETRR